VCGFDGQVCATVNESGQALGLSEGTVDGFSGATFGERPHQGLPEDIWPSFSFTGGRGEAQDKGLPSSRGEESWARWRKQPALSS